MSYQQTVTATIITQDEDFLQAAAEMPPEEAVNFGIAYWRSLDRFPGQTYEDFLPVWKTWNTKRERRTA